MTEKDLDVAIEKCERIMEMDTRTMQNPVSENGWIFEKVYELLQYLRQFQFVPDTNVGDMISRQAAIRWVKTECNPYGKPTLGFESGKKVIEHLEQMPSAQPTLYGYDIKHLAFVASIMAKKGVSPEEAVTIFRDVNRVIEMMLEDMKEMQENALKQTLKKPWEGGQEWVNR